MMDPELMADGLMALLDRVAELPGDTTVTLAEVADLLGGIPSGTGPLEEIDAAAGDGVYVDYPDGVRLLVAVDRTAN